MDFPNKNLDDGVDAATDDDTDQIESTDNDENGMVGEIMY